MTTKELLALVGKWRDGWHGPASNGYFSPPGSGARLALKSCADELAPIATALCAEVEALRKDAERYRWLREKGLSFTHDAEHRGVSTMRWGEWDYDTPEGFAARIDAAIDAARSRNEHEG